MGVPKRVCINTAERTHAAADSQLLTLNLLLKNIILVGFMGSGKSAVGRGVAGRMNFQFVDTDQIVVERAWMPIAEIFAQHGEEHFRDLETAALESLVTRSECVIATGGGVLARERNRTLLAKLGFTVWLTASEEVIFSRVSRNDKRPLLRTHDPRATIREMLAARRPLYASAADFTLDTTKLSHDAAANAVISAALHAWGGGLTI